VQSLGGEGCSLLQHDHFWIASERVVTLGRVGPAAGSSVRPSRPAAPQALTPLSFIPSEMHGKKGRADDLACV
jgi:hypothetical protein